MRDLLRQLSVVLAPRAKRDLLLATIGSVLVAAVDSVAVALVLPLVEVATDPDSTSSSVALVSGLLGNPSRARLTVLLTLAVVGLFVLKGLGAMAFTWWLSGFVYAERVRTSARIFTHMLSLPYGVLSRRSTAELMRTMDEAVMQVFNFTVRGLIASIANGLAVITVLVTLVVVAPVPALLLALYFGGAALAYRRLTHRLSASAGKVMTESSLAGWKAAFAAFGALKELKLRGSAPHFVTRFREAQLTGAYAGRTVDFLAALPRYLLEIMFIIAIAMIVLLGSRGEGSSLALLALFVAAGFRLLPAATALLASSSGIRVGAEPLRLVVAEIEAARADVGDDEAVGSGAEVQFERELRVEGVSFAYTDGAPWVLDGIDLTVPYGSSIALVGPSGAGKTTLVDILLGLHTPVRGRITVDDHDVTGRLTAWRRHCGYVPQDIFLLDASLAENVAFDQDADEIDRDEVRRALDVAQLGELVHALPEGMDAQVGERGAMLSGGQRQRVGIARAIYRQPRLLVLDEATSALDNETEHRVSATIARLHGEVTIIVVAHRLSTVRHADAVVYLEDGAVVAVGTFEELRVSVPAFARLVELGSLDSPEELGETERVGT